jgi:uncharacterized membrane protein YdjX (TVP38/TMEM64 family)
MAESDPGPHARKTACRPHGNCGRIVLLVAASAVLAGALLLAYRLGWWETGRMSFSSVERMRQFVAGFGGWAPAIFFLTQVAQVVLAPIPGGVTVVVGTLTFGVWAGLALSVAGAVVGSAVLFLAVRRWGRPLALRLVGEETFHRYAGALDKKGVLLFVVMLVPFVPDDVVVALAGLSAVSFRRFALLVAVGRTPSWAVTALVTADLATRSAAVLVGAGATVAAVLTLGIWHRRRLEGWLLGLAGRGHKRETDEIR